MIRGRIVRMRQPEPRDVPLLNKWANDAALWNNLGGWHFPYPVESTAAWVERAGSDPRNQVFSVEVPGEGLVGTASLNDIDWKNRSAFHGLMLGEEKDRSRGLAMDSEFAIMRYAFDELGFNRLDADVVGFNERSLRMTAKCGWRVEGVRRGWYVRAGGTHDKVLLGILADEYRKLVAELRYWDETVPLPIRAPAAAPAAPVASVPGTRV
jgi:RimJ/RimL family protein N-acetyltransferase